MIFTKILIDVTRPQKMIFREVDSIETAKKLVGTRQNGFIITGPYRAQIDIASGKIYFSKFDIK